MLTFHIILYIIGLSLLSMLCDRLWHRYHVTRLTSHLHSPSPVESSHPTAWAVYCLTVRSHRYGYAPCNEGRPIYLTSAPPNGLRDYHRLHTVQAVPCPRCGGPTNFDYENLEVWRHVEQRYHTTHTEG